MAKREKFSSRLGFILISAGCAIGLGNVWKFPYVVGQNGGCAFLLLYIIFLLVLGLPLMAIEFSVGRASQLSNARAYEALEPKGSKWHLNKYVGIVGQYVLMMFYTTITGWMLVYVGKEAVGQFKNVDSNATMQIYNDVITDPVLSTVMMITVVLIGIIICRIGLQNGLERVTKIMMTSLLIIMLALAIFALCQPGASEGLNFYLAPNFSAILSSPEVFIHSCSEAMNLAFFTLSLGLGSMLIFGSYINKERALFGEAITIGLLDLFVAFVAGLIIFPTCFSYGISPGVGPSLVFITLPNVFSNMPAGQFWGCLFFIFLSFAALSTVNAVFESIIAFWMDLRGWSRHKSSAINLIVIILLSLPCALGFSVFSGIQFPIDSWKSIMDVEDFIVSNNLLPLGGAITCIFATSKLGWGWKKSLKEINTGKGIKLPAWSCIWVKYVIPALVLIILTLGWVQLFT